MKKFLLAMAVLVMGIATVNAQSHKWFWFGPKAGLTSVSENFDLTADNVQNIWDNAVGYNAGLMFRLNVPIGIFSLHLQPELMYNWTKGTFKNDKFDVSKVTVNQFSIPVLAGAGLDLGLFNARVQAGPVVKFNSSETLENTGKVDWKDVTYTWAAGVGIDLFNFIMIDARMIGGWKDGMEPTNFGEIFNFDNVDKETNTWTLSIGVMF